MKMEKTKKNVRLIPVPAKKGASRSIDQKNNPFKNFTLGRMIFLTAITITLVIFYVSFLAVETVLNVPVNQVDFERDFTYLTENEITDVINTHVINGFLTVDLKKLQLEFKKLPWVDKVNIKRKLPNGLSVTIKEQKPYAFWNENELISISGEIFKPDPIPELLGLPKLSGKNYKTVIQVYEHLQKILPQEQQPFYALHIDERNVVKVMIVSKTELIFNLSQLKEQVAMWKKISTSSLNNRLNEVTYVDLRYGNGAAVKFSNSEVSNNESKGQ